MNIKKFSLRTGLGILAIALAVSSVLGISIFSHSFSGTSVSNAPGLVATCTTLVSSSANNNGTTGTTEGFLIALSCAGGLIAATGGGSVNGVTELVVSGTGYTTQQIFSSIVPGSYVPRFTLPTITPTPVSESLWITFGSGTCSTTASSQLTSGTAFALSNACNGATTNANPGWYVYQVFFSENQFGTYSVGSISITWSTS